MKTEVRFSGLYSVNYLRVIKRPNCMESTRSGTSTFIALEISENRDGWLLSCVAITRDSIGHRQKNRISKILIEAE